MKRLLLLTLIIVLFAGIGLKVTAEDQVFVDVFGQDMNYEVDNDTVDIDIDIEVVGGTFISVNDGDDITDWFNLPEGLTATIVDCSGGFTMQVKIAGTALKPMHDILKVNVPAQFVDGYDYDLISDDSVAGTMEFVCDEFHMETADGCILNKCLDGYHLEVDVCVLNPAPEPEPEPPVVVHIPKTGIE